PGFGCTPTAAGRLPSAVASYAPCGLSEGRRAQKSRERELHPRRCRLRCVRVPPTADSWARVRSSLRFVGAGALVTLARRGCADLAKVQELVEDAHAKAQAGYGHALVDTVEHPREVQVRRELKRAEPEAPDPDLAEPFRVGSGGKAVRNDLCLRVLSQ